MAAIFPLQLPTLLHIVTETPVPKQLVGYIWRSDKPKQKVTVLAPLQLKDFFLKILSNSKQGVFADCDYY